jgi:hypothetical protein
MCSGSHRDTPANRSFVRQLLASGPISQAWSDGANRVWLHTCTLDDPAALPNYLKRGFEPFKKETYFAEIAPGERLRVPIEGL